MGMPRLSSLDVSPFPLASQYLREVLIRDSIGHRNLLHELKPAPATLAYYTNPYLLMGA